jgi:hypothetical protein
MGSLRHHPANHQSRQAQYYNQAQAPSQLRRRTPPADFLADATTPRGRWLLKRRNKVHRLAPLGRR